MKGLRIGMTTPGATSDLFMRYLFQSNGFDPDHDLEIVPLGGVSTQVAGVQGGRVDGCSCLPPVDVLLNHQGLTVNVLKQEEDIPQLTGVTYGVLYGLASYNKAHPDVALAMARAITRATLLIARDPEAAKHATRPFLKEMDQATFAEAWARTCRRFPRMPTSPKRASTRSWPSRRQCCRRRPPVAYDDGGRCVVRAQGKAGTHALSDEPLIEYRDVGRRFVTRAGAVTACEQVNLTVRQGEFLAVVGPSGCGKSTLLNMAAGLMAPTWGRCSIAGAGAWSEHRCRLPDAA